MSISFKTEGEMNRACHFTHDLCHSGRMRSGNMSVYYLNHSSPGHRTFQVTGGTYLGACCGAQSCCRHKRKLGKEEDCLSRPEGDVLNHYYYYQLTIVFSHCVSCTPNPDSIVITGGLLSEVHEHGCSC